MLKENLKNLCKFNNLNMLAIEKMYDLNKLDEQMLKDIQSNKTRFISTNLNKAETILNKDNTLHETTKIELLNVLKTTDFAIIYDPNKIVDLNSLISFLMSNFQYLIDWYNIENNKLTPPNILDREVAKIANELVELLEQTKQQPLKSAIDLVENKLNKITQATINIKRMFTLTKEDVFLLDSAFQDINSKLKDITAELTNKQLESTIVDTISTIEQPSITHAENNDNFQMLLNNMGDKQDEKILDALTNMNNDIKSQLKEIKDLQLANTLTLVEMDYTLESSKLITAFKNKDVNKKEVINISEEYKLIKVE